MGSIYKSGQYLDATGGTWHSEDSAWKAAQILQIIIKNKIHPKNIAEIGCGAGQILIELSNQEYLKDTQFDGYDISPQAIELCMKLNLSNRCSYYCQDLLLSQGNVFNKYDILLVIDVFEHVPDYIGFIEQCRKNANYKIYHIPLDIHVSSVLRSRFVDTRYAVGHLHYFTAETALATLKDSGHEIIDFYFTNGAFGVFRQHPSIKTAMANVPRWLLEKISLPLSARILGGYSLLVLAK